MTLNTQHVLIMSGTVIVVALIGLKAVDLYATITSNANTDDQASSSDDGDCNVGYVTLHGELVTSAPYDDSTSDATSDAAYAVSSDITHTIRAMESDDSIKAIILAVDSGGGDPVAGDEIEHALKDAKKPTVALIRSQGDSAAYMAAIGADRIVASPFSEVGSIGVTASYVDQSKQDQQDGLTFNQLSTGQYKDMYNPDKPLTTEESALIHTQLSDYLGHFVDMVASDRHLDRDTVRRLADGSASTADDALKNGLIDSIGSIDDVRTYLSKQINDTAVVCGVDTFE